VAQGVSEELVLEHQVGFPEGTRDVAVGVAGHRVDVGVGDNLVRATRVGVEVGVDERDAGRQGGPRVEDGGELLVLHGDEVPGFLGLALGVGRDGRHRLPRVAHPIEGQERLVLDGSAEGEGEVAAGHHRPHPGRRPGLGDVDSHDPGMGVRAPQHRPVEHPRQVQIAAEHGAPGDLIRPVDPGNPLSHRAHEPLSSPAARRTASSTRG